MNTIDSPITKTRRNKDEIAKAQREKDALKSRLAKYIEDNYDAMSGAAINSQGFRVIAITIGLPSASAPAESKAYLGIEYHPEAVRETDSFVLDDGQDNLFAPTGTAPASNAPPAVAPAPGATTEPAPGETGGTAGVGAPATPKTGKGK